jgi:hypothetical protein
MVNNNEYTVPGLSPSNLIPEVISLSEEEFNPTRHLVSKIKYTVIFLSRRHLTLRRRIRLQEALAT